MLKSIILIGFKHVGKSTIGEALANKLSLPFIDLDKALEKVFAQKYAQKKTCRQIVQSQGEVFFRNLEKQVFHEVIHSPPVVLALGGGAPLEKSIQMKLKNHTVLHIEAPPALVFTRIMSQGHPTIFPQNQLPEKSFDILWKEREVVYKKLANITVYNTGSVEFCVNQILEKLNTTMSSQT